MARCIIEDHVKSAMPAVQHAGTAPSTSIDLRRKALRELHDRNKTHPDPIFVALYHTKAPVHLIEWARRRRTYSYLGITGVIAAGLGALSGLLLVAYLDGSAIWKSASDSQAAVRVGDIVSFFLIAVTALLLLINIYDLSRRMKQDADQMELVWALMETDQHARKALFKDADSNSAIPPTRRRLWTMKRK
jgi:MFS family permease